jgi:hypothetical protein
MVIIIIVLNKQRPLMSGEMGDPARVVQNLHE